MGDGPVVLEQVLSDNRLRHDYRGASNNFQDITITGTAQLRNSCVNYNHFYDDDDAHILDALSNLAYHDVHRQIQYQRLDGTGSSLLSSDEYRQWRDETHTGGNRTHSLWCYGSSGIGKTFIASTVIDDLRTQVAEEGHALVYMYADRDRVFEQTVGSYLCSFAR